jgi:hypothetical protein
MSDEPDHINVTPENLALHIQYISKDLREICHKLDKICDKSRVQPGPPDSLWPGECATGGRNISPDRQGGAMTRGHSILLFLSWFVCCFAAALIINYTYYQVMPIEHWVEYETVKPLKPVVKVGQPLEFVSIKDTHRGCDLTFNDILYCKNGARKLIGTMPARTAAILTA